MRNREAEPDSRVVFIPEEHVFGEIVGYLGAYYTTISYTKGGIEYEVLMENDEFTLLEDLIEYDD
jgi:hypothetical protein